MYVLSQYDMKKLDKNGWEYELTIPYENDEDLDDLQAQYLKSRLKFQYLKLMVTLLFPLVSFIFFHRRLLVG